MREIARAAYRAGARIVEPTYVDRHFTRALIELGPDESLDYTPPWALNMLSSLEAEKGAFIQVSGDPEPELLADLPGDHVGRALPRELQAQWTRMVSERVVTWTIVPAPTQAGRSRSLANQTWKRCGTRSRRRSGSTVRIL